MRIRPLKPSPLKYFTHTKYYQMVFGNNKYLPALFSGYGPIEAKGVRLTPFCYQLFFGIYFWTVIWQQLFTLCPIQFLRYVHSLNLFRFGVSNVGLERWDVCWCFFLGGRVHKTRKILFCVNVKFEVVMYKTCLKKTV